MLEHHSVFVAEASLLRRFLARTAAAGFQPGSPVAMNIDELALAFEDLPEDIHATVRMALMRVGAENPVISCDLHVLVDEAAEPVSP
jgi:hypothetical protein